MGKKMGRLIVDRNDWTTEPEEDHQWAFSLVDNRSSYAEAMSLSGEAKFGFSGGDASTRASLSHSFQTSELSVLLILTKRVLTQVQSLTDPRWNGQAVPLIRHPDAFIQSYGDLFIRQVHLGGLLSIVYTLTFFSMKEVTDFRANAEGKYGGSSGAVDFHKSIVQTATAQSINVRGLCRGVKDDPNMFKATKSRPDPSSPPTGVDYDTGDVDDREDPVAEQLIRYFDDFTGHVQQDGKTVPIYIDTPSIYTCNGSPQEPRIDLSDFDRTLEQAAELDDEISDRLSKAKYMKAEAWKWNPEAKPDDTSALVDNLIKSQGQLSDAADAVAHLQIKPPKLPLSESDLPRLPDAWVLHLAPSSTLPSISAQRSIS